MIKVIHGDCREVMRTLPAGSFHACVTDPPYHLTTDKRGGSGVASLNLNSPAGRSRIGTGFMGKAWDGGDVSFRPETWRAVYDLLLPGAYMVAFASTRGYHRMVCAIEDAGFIIHPMLGWLFGSGFAKAANASKAIDKHFGKVREVIGQHHRHGGGSAVSGSMSGPLGTDSILPLTAPATPEAAQWEGWAYGLQSLKPALEPICCAQKPMEGTGAQNLLKYGVGAVNIDACRVAFSGPDDEAESKGKNRHADFGSGPRDNAIYGADGRDRGANGNYNPPSRWPANIVHDGSPEVLESFAAFGERASGSRKAGVYGVGGSETVYGERGLAEMPALKPDAGSAARFFYSAKADAADRADSKHPTVKPVDLMRWLVQLVTPPGGQILDPFAGSGTTGEAAMLLGFDCTLIEADAQHVTDIKHRIKRWSGLDTPLFAAGQ